MERSPARFFKVTSFGPISVLFRAEKRDLHLGDQFWSRLEEAGGITSTIMWKNSTLHGGMDLQGGPRSDGYEWTYGAPKKNGRRFNGFHWGYSYFTPEISGFIITLPKNPDPSYGNTRPS